MPEFDVATASRDWDRTHWPADLDPPYGRNRITLVRHESLEAARPASDSRSRLIRWIGGGPFGGRGWHRMTDGQRRKLARNMTFIFMVEAAGLPAREAARLLGISHRGRVEILSRWRGWAREVAATGEDD
jgi:hypothetical protein